MPLFVLLLDDIIRCSAAADCCFYLFNLVLVGTNPLRDNPAATAQVALVYDDDDGGHVTRPWTSVAARSGDSCDPGLQQQQQQ